MTANYGLPYMGSKNKIARDIVSILPKADTLVDLFAGGCAITHAALMTRKYKNHIVNDIGNSVKLFIGAVNSEYKPRRNIWVNRDTFRENVATDPFIAFCWSFGYNGREYAYNREIEPYKEALFAARINKDFSLFKGMGIDTDATRADIIRNRNKYKEIYINWFLKNILHQDCDYAETLKTLTERTAKEKARLQTYLRTALKASGLSQTEVDKRNGNQMSGHYFGNCQWEFPTKEIYDNMRSFMPLPLDYAEVYDNTEFVLLNQVEKLSKLENFERLEVFSNILRVESLEVLRERAKSITYQNTDYRAVDLPDGCVIYCDPPYANTAGYQCGEFDNAAFCEWAREVGEKHPIFVSEYQMPSPFVEVWNVSKTCSLSSHNNGLKTIERLYTLPKWAAVHNNTKQLTLWK